MGTLKRSDPARRLLRRRVTTLPDASSQSEASRTWHRRPEKWTTVADLGDLGGRAQTLRWLRACQRFLVPPSNSIQVAGEADLNDVRIGKEPCLSSGAEVKIVLDCNTGPTEML